MVNGPWGLFGLALSAALLICTPFVWRNRGAVFGLRWFAVAIVPAGLAITGLFTLVARVTNAVTGFFAGSISPLVWVGYALLGLAVLTWVAAGMVSARRAGRESEPASEPAAVGTSRPTVGRASKPATVAAKPAAGDDDEFADVEAILRRRGI